MIKNGVKAPSGTRIMIQSKIRVKCRCVMKDQGSLYDERIRVQCYDQDQDSSWVPEPPNRSLSLPETLGESVHLRGLTFLFCKLG